MDKEYIQIIEGKDKTYAGYSFTDRGIKKTIVYEYWIDLEERERFVKHDIFNWKKPRFVKSFPIELFSFLEECRENKTIMIEELQKHLLGE